MGIHMIPCPVEGCQTRRPGASTMLTHIRERHRRKDMIEWSEFMNLGLAETTPDSSETSDDS